MIQRKFDYEYRHELNIVGQAIIHLKQGGPSYAVRHPAVHSVSA